MTGVPLVNLGFGMVVALVMLTLRGNDSPVGYHPQRTHSTLRRSR
jgi:hypothetical protein